MLINEFRWIKERLNKYTYNSLNYTEYQDVKEYDILLDCDEGIVLYGLDKESNTYNYHFAGNTVETLLPYMNKRNDHEKITFAPKEWVQDLEMQGFILYGIWRDYFVKDLDIQIVKHHLEDKINLEDISFINESNYEEASKVTLECNGCTRGFEGESATWMYQWMKNEGTLIPDYVNNTAIIPYFLENEEMAGIVIVGTYGENDSILWVRMVAVRPKYQRMGIGKKLLLQAFCYGKVHGATKAFLMADECNTYGIRLYESVGFVRNEEELGQIDLVR